MLFPSPIDEDDALDHLPCRQGGGGPEEEESGQQGKGSFEVGHQFSLACLGQGEWGCYRLLSS